MTEGNPDAPGSPVVASTSPGDPTGHEDVEARHPSFHPGARIADKYVVERPIGEGGLGVVVAARHVHLDQTVAIKYLRPKVLANKGVADRFLREAKLSAKMRSEHIVHVYDVGTLPDGAPYMVMEYLAGTDLGRQLNASGPLTVERAIDYILQACEALAEAHVAGIVHRDIKPDNLFIATSPGGKSILKILDFGISKMSSKRTTSSGQLRELTEAGDKFGTPVYMSPEQLLSSGSVDARADVWATGVVLYELLTGDLPFDGEGLPELCTAILNKPPVPLCQVRPYLPIQLQTVIEQCLEKDVDKRFQNVAELAQALRPFVGPTGHERIDQVVRVIEGGGEKVRAATPVPGAQTARALRDVSTMSESERVATTGSGMAAWGPATVAPNAERAGLKRMRVLAVTGAAVLAGALFVAAFTGTRSSQGTPAAAKPAAEAPAAPAPGPAAELALPPAPATAADSPVEPSSAADAPAPDAPSSAPAAPSRGGPRRTPKRAPTRDAKPSYVDPNSVINPFE